MFQVYFMVRPQDELGMLLKRERIEGGVHYPGNMGRISGIDVARFLIKVYRDKKKRNIYTLKTVIIALVIRFGISLALN